MKSAILEKGEKHYTYMKEVFTSIKNKQLNYNWLITNCECYPQDENLQNLFSQEYLWISGNLLTEIINEQNFQFIWAVFSGFSKEVTIEEVLQYDLPFADGYEGFWLNDVGIQHPLAEIEIVAWDSSLTLFISKDEDLVQKFKHSNPLSEDLSTKNTRNNSEIAHIEELLAKELSNRNYTVNEEMLRQKYLIWRSLYSNREKVIKDEDILQFIEKKLK